MINQQDYNVITQAIELGRQKGIYDFNSLELIINSLKNINIEFKNSEFISQNKNKLMYFDNEKNNWEDFNFVEYSSNEVSFEIKEKKFKELLLSPDFKYILILNNDAFLLTGEENLFYCEDSKQFILLNNE